MTRAWKVRLLEAGIVIGWIGGGVSGAVTYFNAWFLFPAVVFSGLAFLAMWRRNRLDAPPS